MSRSPPSRAARQPVLGIDRQQLAWSRAAATGSPSLGNCSYHGGPAPDLADNEGFAVAWASAGDARQRCFDTRAARTAGAAAAGIEALLAERAVRRTPNAAASRKIAEDIRIGLEDVSRLLRD